MGVFGFNPPSNFGAGLFNAAAVPSGETSATNLLLSEPLTLATKVFQSISGDFVLVAPTSGFADAMSANYAFGMRIAGCLICGPDGITQVLYNPLAGMSVATNATPVGSTLIPGASFTSSVSGCSIFSPAGFYQHAIYETEIKPHDAEDFVVELFNSVADKAPGTARLPSRWLGLE